MSIGLPVSRAGATPLNLGRWRSHVLALAIAMAAVLVLFARDATDMVGIWFESSTFNHCAAILPIIVWLIWQRLPELRTLEPAAWWPGLLIVGTGALAWLLGEAGGLALARHVGLVVMLQGAAVTILGRAVSRGLAFPIFYAFFLIPAGEEIVPLMQTVTAEMCMVLLGLFGVPAHIEGVFISTPTGYFEVAEACSGVEFLVAMLAFGALAANVCFRSWRRRAAFMSAAIVIPVLANGLRAFGTIYIAHLTSVDFAAGVDHVVFGWFFFALVVAVTLGIGWRFFDRKPGDPWLSVSRDQATGKSPSLTAAFSALVALAALPLVWSSLMASTPATVPSDLVLPDVVGWQRAEARGRPWQPHFEGADLFRIGRYRNASGDEVDLAIAVYVEQEEGREIVGHGRGAIDPDGAWAWTASLTPPPSGRADRIVSFGLTRDVLSFYRVGRILTGSEAGVKLETMKMRLLGGPKRAVAVLVSAEAPAEGASPRPAMDAFLTALGPVDRLADQAAGG